MDSDPFQTQRDDGMAVAAQLHAAGFADAEVVGRGGFGIVYRCHQRALDRVVAVKVLTTDLDEDRERFVREQRAMGRLTGHPNIVGVMQVGETEGGYLYLVMQYHQHGSLEARLKRFGRIPPDEALRLGVKMSGALDAAHGLHILHRDVKPANILITDFGEPALSDFGIAHIAGGFLTAAGTFTGSPAFTAPEILAGDPPTPASDVYGLGATLFAALTGHAAFERRSGEHMVAQFLRITTDPVPDLRDTGIPDDIAIAVELAMARDPRDRPSAADFGRSLQRLQRSRGLTPDTMAARTDQAGQFARTPMRRPPGNLPLELTSFVGRRAQLKELHDKLAMSRLVTVTGIGGVGKTRLAVRASTDAQQEYSDGTWLIELGELHDAVLVTEMVATTLGLRDEPGRSLRDVLIDYLHDSTVLLVLDNCEQVVDEAAKLADALLRHCPALHILATSRERLGVGAEAVVQLSPLDLSADGPQSLRVVPMNDAVALFADRAAAAVPGFALTPDNAAVVARICARLEGLPLAIELAAARLRAMSAEEILDRLSNRYQLLTYGERDAPHRHRTLLWSVDWSYDLCTPSEQQLWTWLSVFSASFDLAAAEHMCNGDLDPELVSDLLSSLVDKSIVIRIDTIAGVRFRMLDTLRDYGLAKARHAGAERELRRRHLYWYQTLVSGATEDWFSARQLDWIHRIGLETANLRAAGEFALDDSPSAALAISAGLIEYSIARGFLSEMRHGLLRALAATADTCSVDRVTALYGAIVIACLQGDLALATPLVAEARMLVTKISNSRSSGLVAIADGLTALIDGRWDEALVCVDEALAASVDPRVQVPAMILRGRVLEHRGEVGPALIWQEKALSITESAGESVDRSYVLWSLGIGWWVNGKPQRAQQLLRQCVELARQIGDRRNVASCLEVLAWIAGAHGEAERAAVLMGVAHSLGYEIGAIPTALPDLIAFHEECRLSAQETLGTEAFEAAYRRGANMDIDQAVASAFDGG